MKVNFEGFLAFLTDLQRLEKFLSDESRREVAARVLTGCGAKSGRASTWQETRR